MKHENNRQSESIPDSPPRVRRFHNGRWYFGSYLNPLQVLAALYFFVFLILLISYTHPLDMNIPIWYNQYYPKLVYFNFIIRKGKRNVSI